MLVNSKVLFVVYLIFCLHSKVETTDNKLDTRNPMAVVKNYIEEKGMRIIDFFKQMDTDHSGSIDRQEFIDGLAVCIKVYSSNSSLKLQLLLYYWSTV